MKLTYAELNAKAAAIIEGPRSPFRVIPRSCKILELTATLIFSDDALKPFATPGGVLPEPDLLSETHIARISHWRQICSERHEGCPGDDEPRELPTRVIDINTENIQHVKLVNTIRGSKAVYACLSYTWGDGAQYCTTKHNIKDHLERIYIRDLPRTVADAVRLCRALRIPYLWVDALCIVQDDKADWNREAAAMASIYGSATLTITSPSTTACSESFLVRDVGDHYQVSSDWVHAYSGTRGVVTLALSFRPPSPSRSPLYLTPWMQRGWTLQEWVLSPRLLQCGNTMTMFECLQGRCEEVIPDTPEGSFVALKWYDMVNQPPTLAEQNADTEPMDADEASRQSGSVRADGMSRMLKRCSRWRLDPTPRVSWAAIVEEFCGRGLTHSTDKLPALAGLATQFQAYKCATGPKQQSYDYFAGLWWCSNPMDGTPGDDAELPAGLLWRRSQMKRLASYRPPAVYRAPSWSWAAVDGCIRFLGPGTPKLQILHCVCEYEYPGTLSSVTTGWIDAEGLMRRTWVFESDRDIMLSTVVDGHLENEDDHVWHAFFDADDDYDDYDDRMARLGFEELKQLEIFLLLVATDEDLPGDPDSTHQALILKSVATEHGCQPDCFVRLGIATIHCQSEEGSERLHEMFKDWDTKKVRLL